MANVHSEIFNILSTTVFQKLFNSEVVRISELNAAISLLIKIGIPFDVSYSPGTRRVAPGAELTIYYNPTTTINIKIPFGEGGTIFGGVPD